MHRVQVGTLEPAPAAVLAGPFHSTVRLYDDAWNLVATNLYGDLNCDGVVDLDDINAFVALLSQ